MATKTRMYLVAALFSGVLCLDANPGEPRLCYTEFSRCGGAQIDDPTSDKRSAIGDPHGYASAVSQIDHAHSRAEWQRSMSGGQLLRIEAFTAGRLSSCQSLSVP